LTEQPVVREGRVAHIDKAKVEDKAAGNVPLNMMETAVAMDMTTQRTRIAYYSGLAKVRNKFIDSAMGHWRPGATDRNEKRAKEDAAVALEKYVAFTERVDLFLDAIQKHIVKQPNYISMPQEFRDAIEDAVSWLETAGEALVNGAKADVEGVKW
jgi:hypothetical protein